MGDFTEGQLASLGSIGSGIGDIAGGMFDISAGNRLAGMGRDFSRKGREMESLADKELSRLRESRPSISTPGTYYRMAKEAYDQRLLTMRNEQIQRSFSTTVEAAGQYGSRGLGAVSGASFDMDERLRQEALIQNQKQSQALGVLGAAEERTIGRKVDRQNRDEDLAYDERKAGEAWQQYGMMTEQQGINQEGKGYASLISGGAGLATGVAGLAAGPAGSFEEGGEIKKTPGDFSHKDNPIYLVDSNGKIIGEATGGEYIINPKQSSDLKELSKDKSKKGKDKLHMTVRRMVSKFNKK
jgi:hypothetical protein